MGVYGVYFRQLEHLDFCGSPLLPLQLSQKCRKTLGADRRMTTGEVNGSNGAVTRKVGTPERDLEKDVRKFSVFLRQRYFDRIARDARAFKESAVRLLRYELPPRPGRPRDDTVTRATEMRAKRQPWSAVYCKCIPGYGHLDPGNRQLLASRLRTAVRSRRSRRLRDEMQSNLKHKEFG